MIRRDISPLGFRTWHCGGPKKGMWVRQEGRQLDVDSDNPVLGGFITLFSRFVLFQESPFVMPFLRLNFLTAEINVALLS